MTTRRFSSRQLIMAAALLLGVTLVLPLWSTHMEAPQYRNEEALEVHVYPGRVEGDVDEIETLNQYVGVALPLDTPELRASPWILGALLLAACIATVLPARARARGALGLAIAMLAVAIAGGALLQRRLYEMGHVRGESILEGVPDFTPPILGSAKIANFTVQMSLGAGGWTYALAMALVLLAFFVGRHERMLDSAGDAALPSREEASSSKFVASSRLMKNASQPALATLPRRACRAVKRPSRGRTSAVVSDSEETKASLTDPPTLASFGGSAGALAKADRSRVLPRN